MAITSLDQVIAGLPGQLSNVAKISVAAKSTGSFQSAWLVAGTPGAGTVPGSANGFIPDRTTPGALKLNNANGSNQLYLAKLGVGLSVAGAIILYDRLWANSGLSGIVAVPQTWIQPSLTRSVSGEGVEAWLEIYSATGATNATVNLTYTNSQGVSNRTASTVIASSPSVGQMFPFTLQAGDTGIQSTSQVTLSASTGTAGNFGVTLTRRIASSSVLTAGTITILDAIALGMPLIEANSAIGFINFCSTISTGTMIVDMNIIEG